MPSKAALIIAKKIEDYLGRALTEEELLQAEELNLNFFTGPIIMYIDGMMRKGAKREFDLIYMPIMNGLIRGAYRRRDVIKISGRFAEVYKRMHSFTGDGMSNGELESVIFLAENCTNKELDAAIAVARVRGIAHVKYVKAIIEGNRREASRARAVKEFKQFVPDEYGRRERVSVPRVDAIREAWQKKLKDVKQKVVLAEAELNAKKKTKRS